VIGTGAGGGTLAYTASLLAASESCCSNAGTTCRPSATAHQAGTIRFGTDPASSALDVKCRAHEVDNLYVVETRFFPRIDAVNPSLTAIANAMGVGDHLLEHLR
jgi:choline dehydrogenase-like flavoprotein